MARFSILSATLLASLTLTTALAGGASPDAASGLPEATSGVVSSTSPPGERAARRIRAYWTPSRIQAAVPAELRREGATGDATVLERSGSQPNQRQAVAAPATRSFPNRVHGKVFFTIPGQGDFVCSGTVVGSPTGNVVLSAGHCAYDDEAQRFATNWEFIPGYDGNAPSGQRAPFGEWPARKLRVATEWANRGDLRYDVSAAELSSVGGRRIEQVVGARGVSFNQARSQTYLAFGYPAEPPPLAFDGRTLFQCASTYRGTDEFISDPQPNQINCNMTAGSSGGGWVIRNQFVNSVVSYGYVGSPNDLYGPYFGRTAAGVYEKAAGDVRCAGKLPTLVGTSGADKIVGTSGVDVILGLSGRDVIKGLGGNDVICAGGARDDVRGGNGADMIIGGAGPDQLVGDLGGDTIQGGGGPDEIRGRGGEDLLRGGGGDDLLGGGGSSDKLFGQKGDDILKGHAGRDRLDGNDGRNRCNGGSNRDSAKHCAKKIAIP